MPTLDPWPESQHAHRRAVMLSRQAVLFAPIPKSGCTSILWLLARAGGVPPARFIGSIKPQVSRVMAIHDLDLWPESYRWSRLSEEQQHLVLDDDRWLRFTVVRNPARRVWSAWQDKLLLRQPDFLDQYGTAAWFPDPPTSPDQIVADFRAFVRALALPRGERPLDPHWTPQTVLLAGGPALNHVGRTEEMDQVLELVGQRVGAQHTKQLERENSGLLPFHEALYDAECREIVNELYAEDHQAYGYEPLAAGSDDLGEWSATAESLLPAMSQVVVRHRRIGDLQRIAERLERTNDKLEARAETLDQKLQHLEKKNANLQQQVESEQPTGGNR